MPYVPSKKTDGKSRDREIIDRAVEKLALKLIDKITDNFSLLRVYKKTFETVALCLTSLVQGGPTINRDWPGVELARAVYRVSQKYDYQGAFLGELNYAITRLIQRVPGLLVEKGKWQDEFRYWIYAVTVSALVYASRHTEDLELGIDGVFEDIKDEYKRRVNTAYEAHQIIKSGDCYNTPYYTRLIEVRDENEKLIGYMEVMLKRDQSTVHQDSLDEVIYVTFPNKDKK